MEGEKAMMKELDRVVLTDDIPKHGLKKGDIGTVVLVHQKSLGFEIEFVSLDGETLAVVSLTSSQLRPIGRREIAQARQVESVS